MHFYQKFIALIAAMSLLFAVGCGDDDNGDNGNDGNGANGQDGTVSFEVDGAISGSFDGSGHVEDDDRANIHFNNLTTDNTFSILAFNVLEEDGVPAEGSYTVGRIGEQDVPDFSITYTDREGSTDPSDHDSYRSTSGTLEITDSSGDEVAGTFEFEASYQEDNDELDDSVTISVTGGEFEVPVGAPSLFEE